MLGGLFLIFSFVFPCFFMFCSISGTKMVICLIPDHFYAQICWKPGLQGQQIIFIKQNRWQARLSLVWHCYFRNLQVQMLRKRRSFVHRDQYSLLISHCVKITVNMSSFYDPVAWVYMCNCLCAFFSPLNFSKTTADSDVVSEQ